MRFADEAICIGPAKSARSYLDIPSVISAAEITNVDAIHPGYGFLSENADFAEVCETSGIKFIGPQPGRDPRMGVKERARAMMREAGVPILPGSEGVLKSAEEALETAERIGYPVMLKASAGGGGRGMRVVQQRRPSCRRLLAQAQQEAGAAFSVARTCTWKSSSQARATSNFRCWPTSTATSRSWASASAPSSGGIRSCSKNRPRRRCSAGAALPNCRKRCAQRHERRSATPTPGTVEFLMDETGNLYFIEVNARIQVEHPVTEMVTGIDLVKSQILIAAGEPLPRSSWRTGQASGATPSSAASTPRIPKPSRRRRAASPV